MGLLWLFLFMSSHFLLFHVQLIHATLDKGLMQGDSDYSTNYISFQNATLSYALMT